MKNIYSDCSKKFNGEKDAACAPTGLPQASTDRAENGEVSPLPDWFGDTRGEMLEDALVGRIVDENRRRNEALPQPCDPIVGDSASADRTPVRMASVGLVYLPLAMVDDPEFRPTMPRLEYELLRQRYDFEFWAATCVKIHHKLTGRMSPFILNAPQRRVVEQLEADRRVGRPLRFIILKARQWGASTLIQMYFAWIQITVRTGWHSLICAQVKDTAAVIRGMYSQMLANYPAQYWQPECKPCFKSWEGALNTREIAGRDSHVTVTSSVSSDAARGFDFAMAHLSEVAYWRAGDGGTPQDFVRNVVGGIPQAPGTVIVMESTANGSGNFFHMQWDRAKAGESAFRPIFVPWFEIEIYRSECLDPEGFIRCMDSYERELWNAGLTLEMIQWYHNKRRELPSDEDMRAEYPTTPEEAFNATDNAVFDPADVGRLRVGCTSPIYPATLKRDSRTAALLAAVPQGDGQFKMWHRPDPQPPQKRNRYVVAVDIGGRSRKSDYSVIAVFDRFPSAHDTGHHPVVAAQWRGHADHDIVASFAADIGRFYHNALLVIESNTLDSERSGASTYLLEELNRTYHNLYVRPHLDNSRFETMAERVGFHTNSDTKATILTHLIRTIRCGGYTERDPDAIYELLAYERRADGTTGARHGQHDDIVMSRAIGLYVCHTLTRRREVGRSDLLEANPHMTQY